MAINNYVAQNDPFPSGRPYLAGRIGDFYGSCAMRPSGDLSFSTLGCDAEAKAGRKDGPPNNLQTAPIPNPQSPIPNPRTPNPQSPIPNPQLPHDINIVTFHIIHN